MTISCASLPSCSLKTPAAGLDIIADYVSRREGLSASMVVRSGWRALGNSGRGLRYHRAGRLAPARFAPPLRCGTAAALRALGCAPSPRGRPWKAQATAAFRGRIDAASRSRPAHHPLIGGVMGRDGRSRKQSGGIPEGLRKAGRAPGRTPQQRHHPEGAGPWLVLESGPAFLSIAA